MEDPNIDNSYMQLKISRKSTLNEGASKTIATAIPSGTSK